MDLSTYLSQGDMHDLYIALVIGLVFLAVTFIVRRYIIKKILKIVARTKTTIDDYLIPSFTRPFYYGMTLVAVYICAKLASRFSTMQAQVDQAGIVFVIVWVAYTAIKVLTALAAWRFSMLSPDRQKVRGYTTILKIGLHIIIWMIAGSMVLHRLGIDITPIVATLGVGGLAVGLALQDTLANLFAGFYVVIEKSIEPGDYVELEGLQEVKGHIEEISWRTTKIKTLSNNRVVVPNSKLAQSITINYSSVDKSTWLAVPFFVSYDNNLDAVERALKKMIKEFVKEHPHAVKSEEPYVSFSEFGEYNIKCSVGLAVDEFANYYSTRTALVKHLKRELERHKIGFSYPRMIISQKRSSFLS